MKYIFIASFILLLGAFGYIFFDQKTKLDNLDTRLDACRTLAEGVDNLLMETDSDRVTYAIAVQEVLDNQISVYKFGSILEELSPKVDQRTFRYRSLIDRFNDICFEVKR